MKLALSIITHLLLAALAHGQYGRSYSTCGATYTTASTYVAPTYAPPATVITPYVQTIPVAYFPLPIPTYVTGYIGAPTPVVAAAPAQAAPVCDTSALKAEMAELKAQIRNMSQSQPNYYSPQQAPQMPYAPKPQAQQGLDAEAQAIANEVNTSCVKCHSAKDASRIGGGFSLEQPITTKIALAMFKRVTAGDPKLRMPPAGHLPVTPDRMVLYERLLERTCDQK